VKRESSLFVLYLDARFRGHDITRTLSPEAGKFTSLFKSNLDSLSPRYRRHINHLSKTFFTGGVNLVNI
jgi:hypothetical protein